MATRLVRPVWAWPVAEAPSSNQTANTPAAMERQNRCDVFEAAAEVEELKEGIDELTNDTKARRRADEVAIKQRLLNCDSEFETASTERIGATPCAPLSGKGRGNSITVSLGVEYVHDTLILGSEWLQSYSVG